jgi:hypothetical protein
MGWCMRRVACAWLARVVIGTHGFHVVLGLARVQAAQRRTGSAVAASSGAVI